MLIDKEAIRGFIKTEFDTGANIVISNITPNSS